MEPFTFYSLIWYCSRYSHVAFVQPDLLGHSGIEQGYLTFTGVAHVTITVLTPWLRPDTVVEL